MFVAFQRAKDGVDAAVAAQQLIGAYAWPELAVVRVRMGLHTGEPVVESGVYLGLDVNRAARICSAGHGGQILLSQTTRDLVAGYAELTDLGAYALAGLPRPEQLFGLVAPGLQSDFPPLRVEGADRSRRRGMLLARRSRQPSLEEIAWRVRTLLPKAAPPFRKPLAELGAELFSGYRAMAGAENFLSQIDRKRLADRLAAQRDAAHISESAHREAETIEEQIVCVDRLLDSRQALAELAVELTSNFDKSRPDERVASFRGRFAAATAELDDALTRAARVLDPLSFKLTRTSRRGVYRSRRKYVVPFVDDLGRDRRSEFETLAEARRFRSGLRVAAKAQREFTPFDRENFTGH